VGPHVFKRGDWALLLEERGGYKTVARVGGGRIQTIRGFIDTDKLVGAPHGSEITTSLGVKFRALSATIFDVIENKFELRAQAIYPKDAVYIIKAIGLGPGFRVAEAGTGSGFLTAVLAWYVRPWGVVYSFDNRIEHMKVAVRNLGRIDLLNYVDLQVRDVVRTGFGSIRVDAVVLDMGDPWNALDRVSEALKPGGVVVIFATTVEHMAKSVEALRKRNYVNISIEEVLVRRWKSVPGELRPETFDVTHTGWIISARLV
jgi:tRNA (adenine57-N1/adenine58-N1)-methyltransferase